MAGLSRIALLLSGALVALSSAMPVAAAGLRSFKDWTVACDNTRFCRAIGTRKERGASEITYVLLDRAGGPNGALRFVANPELNGDTPLIIDGKTAFSLPKDSIVPSRSPLGALGEADPDQEDSAIVDAALVGRIIEAALNGRTLALSAQTAPEDVVSLEGFKAALLWMDEQQGRAGTVTALVARGDKPASAVPAAAEPPLRPAPPKRDLKAVDDAREAQAVAAFHRKNADRDACSDIPEGDYAPTRTRIAPRTSIYSAFCWRAAYQGGVVYYVVDGGRIAKAKFERLDERTGQVKVTAAGSITDGGDDGVAGVVTHFHKGRGIGDCAESASWHWDGKIFRLASQSVMPICGGVSGNHWFALWRSREK